MNLYLKQIKVQNDYFAKAAMKDLKKELRKINRCIKFTIVKVKKNIIRTIQVISI